MTSTEVGTTSFSCKEIAVLLIMGWAGFKENISVSGADGT